MVLLEAMALGLPIVSTDCPYGPREALADGKFGHLVPLGDYQALSVALTRLLSASDRDLSAELSLNEHLNEHLKNFTIERMVAKYEQLFERMVA